MAILSLSLTLITLGICLGPASRAMERSGSLLQFRLTDYLGLMTLIAVFLVVVRIVMRDSSSSMYWAIALMFPVFSWFISLVVVTAARVGRPAKRLAFVFHFPMTMLLAANSFVQVNSFVASLSKQSTGSWLLISVGQMVAIMLLRVVCGWIFDVDSDLITVTPPRLFRR